jgi:hypothetical protein
VPASRVERVDLLERPMAGDLRHEGGVTKLKLRPWEIVSLRVR